MRLTENISVVAIIESEGNKFIVKTAFFGATSKVKKLLDK
jgi:hypothetical protein